MKEPRIPKHAESNFRFAWIRSLSGYAWKTFPKGTEALLGYAQCDFEIKENDNFGASVNKAFSLFDFPEEKTKVLDSPVLLETPIRMTGKGFKNYEILDVDDAFITGDSVNASYDLDPPTGIHREFANTEISEEGILKFANKYGFLGRHLVLIADATTEIRKSGEEFSFWKNAIEDVRNLLNIYDTYKKLSKEEIETDYRIFIKNKKRDMTSSECETSFTELFTSFNRGSLIEFSEKLNKIKNKEVPEKLEKLFQYTLRFPVIESNEILYMFLLASRHMSPLPNGYTYIKGEGYCVKFFQVVKEVLREQVNKGLKEGAYAATSLEQSKPYILIPKDLLGAIYISLANEIVGQTLQPRECGACMKWFYPENNRQKYCDIRCRQRSHYQRKKEVKQNEKTRK